MPVVLTRSIWSRAGTQWSSLTQERCFSFEDRSSFIMPCAGVISHLRVDVNGALTSGRTRTITLRKGTIGSLSNTALSVAFTEPSTGGQDLVNAISVADGDCISWQGSISPADSGDDDLDISFLFTPLTPGDMFYAWSNGSNLNGPLFQPLCTGVIGAWPGSAVGDIIGDVVAVPGNITRIHIKQRINASGGDWAFNVWKNTTKQDGSGGTVDTTTTIASGTQLGSWSGSCPISVLDGLKIGVAVGSGTPAAGMWQGSVCINSTNKNESNFFVTTENAVSNSVNIYNGKNCIIAWNTTESNRTCKVGPDGLRLVSLYTKLTGSPGGSTSYTIGARKNSSSPGGTLSAVISGSNTTGQDTSGQTSYSLGDTFSVLSIPTSSPAGRGANVGFGQRFGSGGGGGNKGGNGPKGVGGKSVFGPTGMVFWDSINGFGQ